MPRALFGPWFAFALVLGGAGCKQGTPVGGACHAAADCSSNLCEGSGDAGRCQCAQLGGPCGTDQDCCGGACCGACQQGPCQTNQSCDQAGNCNLGY